MVLSRLQPRPRSRTRCPYLVQTVTLLLLVLSPTSAWGQYSFGDWARDQGYSPGDAMPDLVDASSSDIDSLAGIGDFDWNATPTSQLRLDENQISSIKAVDFSGLPNLTELSMGGNGISSIDAADFSALSNLTRLRLHHSQLSSIDDGDFSELTNLTWLGLIRCQISSIDAGDFRGLGNLTTLDLRNNQISSIETGAFSELPNLTGR